MDQKAVKVAVLFCVVCLSVAASFGQAVTGQPNPEPVIAPGTDLNKGREAPLRRSEEQMIASHLQICLNAYATETAGRLPNNWNQLEETLGAGIWESPSERELIKRRFALVSSSGNVPHSTDSGPIEGTLVSAPLYPIKEQRSAELGRFTVWRSVKGAFATRWLTESELRTFSNWGEIETKIEAAKAAVAAMPPLVIESTHAPQSRAAPPVDSTSVPTSTPALSSTGPAVAESPVPTVERKAPVWPWVVGGILALVVIVALALKRRA